MSVAITIQLSPGALAVADKYRRAPTEFPRAIKRGMDKGLAIVAGRIQERRLTGRGPFPVSEHRLGERSGQLKLRTYATPARITGTGDKATVSGAIGSPVFYAGFNEFGTSRTPERAPFRTGIRENVRYLNDTIEKEISTAL